MPEPAQLQHIEELYYDALELPAAEREAFLASACAGDVALRHEVASLLAARAEAAGFLSRPVLELSLPGGEQRPNLTARLGSTIGHYKLLSVLGVGGMGEVFLAEDTRLHRQVALKLLPAEFSQSPQRIHRFEQEARATTALNHPNIVTLHDTGQFEDAYYIVTEFVDGQTLREHLNEHSSLPISEALNLAQQIATALAAAHAAGIVHRDIKPENVMLRRDGFVKVLDFGLAKLTDTLMESAVTKDETHEEETPQSAIRNPQSQTAAGALLGTIRYMSPEQARGETVDARTDVFSLGVVLHEMLTGRTPFHRESARETLAAILEAVPTALPEQIPAVLQQLVTSALCKDREQRWQTAEKFAASLRESVEELQFSARLAVTGKSTWGRWQRWVGGLLVVITLAAVASYFAAQRRAVAPLTDPAQLQMNLIADWKAEPEEANAAASVAPDEQTIAFTKGENGQVDLYLKPLRNGDAVRLTNDAWRDAQPLWSPDGKQLIYVSTRNDQHEIWRISSQGGQAELVTVLNQSFLVLLRWSQDEKRIFYLTECDLCALDLQTKATFRLTNFDRRKCKISEMALSQDERWIAYAEDTNGTRQIWAMDALQLGMPIQVSREGEANLTPLWHPDGKRIIYRCKRAGVWQLCAGYLNGEPATQLTFGHENLTPWHIARDGKRILYRTERNTAALFRYDLSRGDETRISSGQQLELSPALAPDGQTVAYQQADSAMNLMNSTIQVTDNHGTQTAQLEANAFDPRWSPQQDKLAFLRPQSGRWSLWTMNRDGSEAQAVVKEGVFSGSYSPQPFHWLFPPAYSWSPTGDRLAYVTRPANISNVWTINRDGSHAENVTANTDAMAVFQSPFWSPDGSRLIYLATRNVSGPRDWNLMSAAADQRHNHYRSDRRLRLLGWLPNGDQLIFANAGAAVSSPITDVQLSKIELANNAITPVAFLSAAYLSSLLLAPDARQAAFTRHINGRDELWTISLTDGRAEKLRAREEPFVYFAGLAWSPDSRSIYFSKQSTAIALWAIDNFR